MASAAVDRLLEALTAVPDVYVEHLPHDPELLLLSRVGEEVPAEGGLPRPFGLLVALLGLDLRLHLIHAEESDVEVWGSLGLLVASLPFVGVVVVEAEPHLALPAQVKVGEAQGSSHGVLHCVLHRGAQSHVGGAVQEDPDHLLPLLLELVDLEG